MKKIILLLTLALSMVSFSADKEVVDDFMLVQQEYYDQVLIMKQVAPKMKKEIGNEYDNFVMMMDLLEEDAKNTLTDPKIRKYYESDYVSNQMVKSFIKSDKKTIADMRGILKQHKNNKKFK